MGSTTPIFGWPFPTGSDRVMDGDNAIEGLARAIEASFSGIRPVQKPSTADLQLTPTNTPLPGLSLGPYQPSTVNSSEIWVAIYSVFFHATTMGFGDCTADLMVNGVSNGSVQYSPPAVPDRLTVTNVALFGVGIGVPTTLSIQSKCSLAAGVVKARTGSQIVLLRFPLVSGTLRERVEAELRPVADE